MKTTDIMQKMIDEIKNDPEIREKDNETIIVKELCTKIQSDENAKLSEQDLKFLLENGPSGALIYLTLIIPPQRNQKEFSYLTLENDPLTGWSVGYYVDFGKTKNYKLKKRHDIKAERANYIMTNFAKIYKAYLGKQAINL